MKRKFPDEAADDQPARGVAQQLPSSAMDGDALSRAAERLCDWCMDKDTSLLRSKVECQSFVIADMTAPDCPIRYASDGFLELTGYTREEIADRNCRFLQGCAPRLRLVQRCSIAMVVGVPLCVRHLLRLAAADSWRCECAGLKQTDQRWKGSVWRSRQVKR
jgi:PAS domain-containing protein